MYTTYYLSSAQEADNSIIDAIKAAFKSKSITITVEENSDELTPEMKAVLDERLNEDTATYLTGEDSLNKLRSKYGV